MHAQKTTKKKVSSKLIALPCCVCVQILTLSKPRPFFVFMYFCKRIKSLWIFKESTLLCRRWVIEVTPSSRSQCLIGFLSLGCPFSMFEMHMDVSKNSGTPKSSILIGFSLINHLFWGTPIFGNTTHIVDGRNSTATKRYENRFSKKKVSSVQEFYHQPNQQYGCEVNMTICSSMYNQLKFGLPSQPNTMADSYQNNHTEVDMKLVDEQIKSLRWINSSSIYRPIKN